MEKKEQQEQIIEVIAKARKQISIEGLAAMATVLSVGGFYDRDEACEFIAQVYYAEKCIAVDVAAMVKAYNDFGIVR